MTQYLRCACLAAAAMFLMSAVPVQAEEKVVAKVNGKVITEKDMALAEKEIGPASTGCRRNSARRKCVVGW